LQWRGGGGLGQAAGGGGRWRWLTVGESVVYVLAVGTTVRKPFVTFGALEWFLPTVKSLVLS